MKDYYKIGEISKIYSIGRDSLMYYEEIGILRPIRDKNGYRLYSISDIWKLNLIKELRALNLPMSTIKEYVDNRNIQTTVNMLNKEVELIEEKILELNQHKQNIKTRLDSITNVLNDTDLFIIQEEYIIRRKAIMLNGDITRDSDVDFLVKKLNKEYEGKFNILGNNNIGAIYNYESIKNGIYNEYKSVFCLVDDDENNYNLILEGGRYILYSYRGAYRENHKHFKKINKYIKEKGYKIIDNPIEIYKVDIHETSLESEFYTEIQIRVEEDEEK